MVKKGTCSGVTRGIAPDKSWGLWHRVMISTGCLQTGKIENSDATTADGESEVHVRYSQTLGSFFQSQQFVFTSWEVLFLVTRTGPQSVGVPFQRRKSNLRVLAVSLVMYEPQRTQSIYTSMLHVRWQTHHTCCFSPPDRLQFDDDDDDDAVQVPLVRVWRKHKGKDARGSFTMMCFHMNRRKEEYLLAAVRENKRDPMERAHPITVCATQTASPL